MRVPLSEKLTGRSKKRSRKPQTAIVGVHPNALYLRSVQMRYTQISFENHHAEIVSDNHVFAFRYHRPYTVSVVAAVPCDGFNTDFLMEHSGCGRQNIIVI